MATKDVSFDIFLSDYTSSIDEWRRAQEAPVSELPDLNEEQKEVARKFKISREEYARGAVRSEKDEGQDTKSGRISAANG